MPSSEGACVCVHVSGRRPEVSPVAFGLCSSVACRKGSFDQTRRINAERLGGARYVSCDRMLVPGAGHRGKRGE